MHQAAVVGVQRLHLHRLAALLHAFGQGTGLFQQAGLVAFPVVIAIHLHAGCILHLALDHAVDQVLEVVQSVPVSPDDVLGIRGGNIQAHDAVRLRYFNIRGKTQGGQKALQTLFSYFLHRHHFNSIGKWFHTGKAAPRHNGMSLFSNTRLT